MSDGLRYVSDEMTVDCFGRDRVEVRPGTGWGGELPPAFFGTLTAAQMTLRGGIAIHGSAVEVNGKAVLLCGTSGAGKSTLAAALVASGGRLISDDLSVLQRQGGDEPPVLFAGRRTIRLFADVAGMLADCVPVELASTQDPRKMVVIPPCVDPWKPVPLGEIIILESGVRRVTRLAAFHLLKQHLYRPRLMRCLPGHEVRLLQLLGMLERIPLSMEAPIEARDSVSFRRYAERTRSMQ